MFTLNDLVDWQTITKIRGKKILLSGLNFWTKLAMKQLLKLDIFVEGFFLTDEQAGKKNLRYLNKPMFFLNDLCPSGNYFLVNASEECLRFKFPANISLLNLWHKELFAKLCDKMAQESFSSEEFSFQTLEGTKITYLNYLIHCSAEKSLILCGTLKEIVTLSRKFELLGVKIEEALDAENFIGMSNNLKFISPYDLFYKVENKFMVVVLPQAEEFVLNFLDNSGLNPASFIRYEDIRRFDVPVCFDPNLGYNLKGSLRVFSGKSCESKNFVRIGILGGSTSDSVYFSEKSWAEHLADIGAENKISFKIYNGAVRGYSVSLELVKFIRDMAHLNLDFLISVSGINEYPCAAEENPFVTKYQKIIFEQVAKSKPKNFRRHMENSVCYGEGIDDLAKNWISKERMIHAIAKEFGTKFYAILQPGLLTKDSFSDFDREILEHWFDEKKIARYEILKNIRDEIRKVNLPWIKDFTTLFDRCSEPIYFDGCHLWGNANRQLAEKIFALIEKDL